MNPEKYFEQVINETAVTLISAPILNKLDVLATHQLHFLFSQIYYLVELFPGLLATLIFQTNDIGIRFAIIDNLVDEFGGIEKIRNNDYSSTHSQLLKCFLEKLSTETPAKLVDKATTTKIMLSHFRKLFIHSTLVEVLGAMAAMEGASTKWFNHLYQKLIARKEFSDDDLYFFKLHTVMDEDHGNILKEKLLPLLTDKENLAFFKNGATTAALISKHFYIGLSKEMELS